MVKHKGTRWYKCDFHLHTNASLCFEDKNNSLNAFIDSVVSSKLDCIAITDHNTGKNIDEIKILAIANNIIVFPGVEITCSDAKIHLLVLFDTSATTSTVEDYLIRLGLTRDKFGQADAHIHKTVKDIIEETTKYGGLVIPAHIDEFSGLSNIAQEAKKDVFSLNSLTSVQIVHKPLCQEGLSINGNLPLLEYFKQHYNADIDEGTIKQWYSCAVFIKSIAKLTFSDNPCDEFSAKHGLWGIGLRYSWIKMDEIPTLESLRQALVLPSLRIKNFFESSHHPYALPQMWLKQLSVVNTSITKKGVPLSFEFSPQMTTIIGGRGSGKSSVLRLIRGALGIIEDVEKLPTIIDDISGFYKSVDAHGEGIFTSESIVELVIYKNSILYKLSFTNITSFGNQKLKAQRFNNESKAFENIDADGLSSLFPFEIFDQKQIYEIAKFPNALRTRIDNAIPSISTIRNSQSDKISELLAKAELIRAAKANISQKSNLRAQLDDINAQIKNYNDSGISELLKDRQSFLIEKTALEQVYESLSNKTPSFSNIISEMVMPGLGINKDSSKYFEELNSLVSNIASDIKRIKADLETTKATYEALIEKYKTDISKTNWAIVYKANSDQIKITKTNLEQKGVTSINDFEILLQQKEAKTKELSDLESVEQSIKANEQEKAKLHQEIISSASEITKLRIDFLNGLLQNQNVQIRIKPFRDKSSYEKCFREIIQRDSGAFLS